MWAREKVFNFTSCSDSLDTFSNFVKLKPYNFEATVSDNENTDEEVSCSAMQTK